MDRETKDEVATMLRSVLSSEKNGVPLRVLESEYRVLIGTSIPYRSLGFGTLEAFLKSIPDVVRLSRGPTGESVAKAVVTESTLHVAQMVAGQKSTKSKPVMRSSYRHPVSQRRGGYRHINMGSRQPRQSVPSSRLSPRGSGTRGVYQPRRYASATARGKPQEPLLRRPPSDKQCGGSYAARRSSLDMSTRFQKNQSGSDGERRSPDCWDDTRWKQSREKKERSSAWGTGGKSWDTTGKADSGSNWGKVYSEGDWGKVDSESNWGKVDSEGDWGKVDSGNDSGKVDSGSERGTVDSGSDRSKADAASNRGRVDRRWSEPCWDGSAASQSSKEDEVFESGVEWGYEAKREAPAKDQPSEGSASRWTTRGSVDRTFDVPLKDIKRTVTFSRAESESQEDCRKAAEEKPCRTPTVEPDQPRFDPFRMGIVLVKAQEDKKPGPSEGIVSQTPKAAVSTVLASPTAVEAIAPIRQTLSVSSLPTTPSTVPTAPPFVRTHSLAALSEPVLQTSDLVSGAEASYRKLVAQYASKRALDPTYSTFRGRSAKRGPITWLATLKLGVHSYNSYPNEKATEEEALEEAARKAVLALNLNKGTDAEFPLTPASTKEEIAVLESRVTELVADKPRGLLNLSVPDLYRERFGETLPDSWLGHMARSSRVVVTEIDGNRCILYPRGTTEPGVVSQNGHAPARSPASDKLGEYEQRGEYVDVFITCITNTDNVCFRFMEYAEEYEELTKEMNHFYDERHRPVGDLQEGELYAARVGGAWLRVQLVSSRRQQDEKVECYFVDQGDTEVVAVADLRSLEPQFRELPWQAIQCQLEGLVEYSACDRAVDVLVETLLGKTLIAEVVQKEEPVTVVLYDPWTEVDLNLEVGVRLAEPLLPRPGLIGRAQLCHVTPSGDIYLQVLGPGLDSLVQSMEIVNQYYENNNDPVRHLEPGKLYTCRYSGDRKFYRVVLRSTEPQLSGKFSVFYVDYGNEDSVFLAELRDLDIFGDFVMRLPHQAVRCRLDGVLEGESWTELATSKLWEAVADSSELLVKVTKPRSEEEVASVALFRRIEPNKELISINTALALSLGSARGARS